MEALSLPYRSHAPRHIHGQVMPITLLGVLIASAVLIMMFNTGQKITEKTQVANAADAAAYSGAVWTARHLNFLAYTNRAMIANHVAVGHFVSYVSWFRYISNVVQFLDDYTSWIPYWGTVINIINEVIGYVKEYTEEFADFIVEGIDGLNGMYRVAQMETQASLAMDGLNDIMRRTGQAYDPAIEINDDAAVTLLPTEFATSLRAKISYQRVQLPELVKRYSSGDDDDLMDHLIQQSYRAEPDNSNWIAGNRGWSLTLPNVMRFRKQGSTTETQADDSANWQAKDRIQISKWDDFWHKWKRWQTIGSVNASAEATEFYDDYAGVTDYYNLKGTPGDLSFDIAAVATKRQSEVRQSEVLSAYKVETATTPVGTGDNSLPLAVAALARVEFKRPSDGFTPLVGSKQEYANLFNPFWDVHLAALSWPGG